MLIGFTGLKRCGKDTAAAYVLEKLGAEYVMLADPIKRGLMAMFGFTWEQVNGEGGYDREAIEPKYGVSIRHMLQTLGTDWGRSHVGADVWLSRAAETMDDDKLYVMSDVRFPNEAELCRQNGILIHVYVPDEQGLERDRHESEAGIDFAAEVDLSLPNKKDGLQEYYRTIDKVLELVQERTQCRLNL